ncbi:MAG: DUF1801 domain-containing protein [Bacteroidia bacterium]
MDAKNTSLKGVEDYISIFPKDVQKTLLRIRATIKKAAPKSDERLSYSMPFYEYGGKGVRGRLIYFAAFKKHISLFIIPRDADLIPKEIRKYHVSKATYQFPLDQPFPFDLLEKTIRALVKARDESSAQSKPASKEKSTVGKDILAYLKKLSSKDMPVCELLTTIINENLKKAESKVWHAHPVWFIDGNPIVGFSKQKDGIRLMFWSGADFGEAALNKRGEKFKDASIFYNEISEVKKSDLKRWLKKSEKIQWDYKNIVKRKGKLVRLV